MSLQTRMGFRQVFIAVYVCRVTCCSFHYNRLADAVDPMHVGPRETPRRQVGKPQDLCTVENSPELAVSLYDNVETCSYALLRG